RPVRFDDDGVRHRGGGQVQVVGQVGGQRYDPQALEGGPGSEHEHAVLRAGVADVTGLRVEHQRRGLGYVDGAGAEEPVAVVLDRQVVQGTRTQVRLGDPLRLRVGQLRVEVLHLDRLDRQRVGRAR